MKLFLKFVVCFLSDASCERPLPSRGNITLTVSPEEVKTEVIL